MTPSNNLNPINISPLQLVWQFVGFRNQDSFVFGHREFEQVNAAAFIYSSAKMKRGFVSHLW